jgi:hypothetical protein
MATQEVTQEAIDRALRQLEEAQQRVNALRATDDHSTYHPHPPTTYGTYPQDTKRPRPDLSIVPPMNPQISDPGVTVQYDAPQVQPIPPARECCNTTDHSDTYLAVEELLSCCGGGGKPSNFTVTVITSILWIWAIFPAGLLMCGVLFYMGIQEANITIHSNNVSNSEGIKLDDFCGGLRKYFTALAWLDFITSVGVAGCLIVQFCVRSCRQDMGRRFVDFTMGVVGCAVVVNWFIRIGALYKQQTTDSTCYDVYAR